MSIILRMTYVTCGIYGYETALRNVTTYAQMAAGEGVVKKGLMGFITRRSRGNAAEKLLNSTDQNVT